jgi:hypothetical protein
MTFITISQYFNKLHSALFLLLIVPLLVFIVLYFLLAGLTPDPRREYLIVIPSAAVLDWMVATIIFNKKIKSMRHAQGLGAKLDKYFEITLVRYWLLSAASFLLALGFYLTGSDIFTGCYLVGLTASAMVWPTGRKVSNDLRLTGDEKEMVWFRKDAF